ncbi:MAG: hypothetical protein PHS44_07310 [Candidatus Dojkabacteria bacterium]|nr:hypothetical protein [Candidatus Dojkabacteria bacterium]
MIDFIIWGIITIIGAAVFLITAVLAVYFMVEKVKKNKNDVKTNYDLKDQKEVV